MSPDCYIYINSSMRTRGRSSYYYICAYYYICVVILRFLILLYMCPQTAIYI